MIPKKISSKHRERWSLDTVVSQLPIQSHLSASIAAAAFQVLAPCNHLSTVPRCRHVSQQHACESFSASVDVVEYP